jgi:hypothetical protein
VELKRAGSSVRGRRKRNHRTIDAYGEITVSKDFGELPIPAPLVSRLIELAEIEPWMLVLGPSAGHGASALEVAIIATVECFEILSELVAELRAGGTVFTVHPLGG